MDTERLGRLADIVAGRLGRIAPGERVLIQGGLSAGDLMLEIHRRAVRMGAETLLNVQIGQDRILLREGADALIDGPSAFDGAVIGVTDLMINIHAPSNTHDLAGIGPERLRRHAAALEGLGQRLADGRMRLAAVLFPTAALAQEAGVALEDYEEIVLGASLVDPDTLDARLGAAADVFDAAGEVEIRAPGTDLLFSLAGRRGVVGDGRVRLPDGEVSYAPVEGSARGELTVDGPVGYAGRLLEGLHLVFEEGRVREASCRSGAGVLEEILEFDEGASSLSEFGLGLNTGVVLRTGSPLLDEKMDGTVHLALGRPEPGTGGRVVSDVHLDLVRDMRLGGEILVDGRRVYADGGLVGGSGSRR